MPDDGGVLRRKFVREIRRTAGGMVAFEFGIGWDDLTVELALPSLIFEEFCEREGVQRLPPHPVAASDSADKDAMT